MAKTADQIKAELAAVREVLADRRKAMPAHSMSPIQFVEIEELEERERELLRELQALGG